MIWAFTHGMAFGLGGLAALALMTAARWWNGKGGSDEGFSDRLGGRPDVWRGARRDSHGADRRGSRRHGAVAAGRGERHVRDAVLPVLQPYDVRRCEPVRGPRRGDRRCGDQQAERLREIRVVPGRCARRDELQGAARVAQAQQAGARALRQEDAR